MHKDLEKGKVGEDIFERDFLNFLGIKYINVANCQKFQVQDIDMNTDIGTYEIKANYKDDKQIIIEEFTNINENLCAISKGWLYKSKADLLVFVSKETRVMVIIPFTSAFKKHYESISGKFTLRWNKITIDKNNGRKWQSAIRFIPLSELEGWYSFYKNIK